MENEISLKLVLREKEKQQHQCLLVYKDKSSFSRQLDCSSLNWISDGTLSGYDKRVQ